MTTSPQNTPETQAGFAYVAPVGEREAPAPTIGAEWRRFAAFLKRPSLDVRTQSAQPFSVLLRIYALDMAIMLVLISLAGLAMLLGVELPETAIAGMEFTPVLVALVIIGAPVMEELMFRSWLSGRPAHVFAWLSLAAGFGVAALVGSEGALPSWLFVVAGVIGGVLALALLWRKPAMRWFAKLFPLFYWLSVLSFALVHLANFAEGGAILLALVLPQFVLGSLLGYVRVRIGLWAAMVLHGVHNATALGIASLAMSAN